MDFVQSWSTLRKHVFLGAPVPTVREHQEMRSPSVTEHWPLLCSVEESVELIWGRGDADTIGKLVLPGEEPQLSFSVPYVLGP